MSSSHREKMTRPELSFEIAMHHLTLRARSGRHPALAIALVAALVLVFSPVADAQRAPFEAFDGLFEPARGYVYMPSYEDRRIEAFLARDGVRVWKSEVFGELLTVRDGLLFVLPLVKHNATSFLVEVIDTADGDRAMSCGPIALPTWWGDGPYDFHLDLDIAVDPDAAYLSWTASAVWRPDLVPGEAKHKDPINGTARCARGTGELDQSYEGSLPRPPFRPTVQVADYADYDPQKRHLVSEDLRYMIEGEPIDRAGERWAWKVIDVEKGEKVGSFKGPLPLRFIMDRRTVVLELESVTKRKASSMSSGRPEGCSGTVDVYARRLQGHRLRSGKLKWKRTLVSSARCSLL